MSSSVRYIGEFFALLIVNNIILRLGGDGALAEFNVVQNVSYLALAIYTVLGDTVQPLSGTFYAEHNKTAIKRVMHLGITIGIIGGGVIAALFAALAPGVCALFGLKGSAITAGTFAVRMFCLSVIPAGLNLTWSACFQAIGREKLVFLINQLRTFVCFTAFALILSLFDLLTLKDYIGLTINKPVKGLRAILLRPLAHLFYYRTFCWKVKANILCFLLYL